MFENLMEALKVEREGPGRARASPDRTMTDKAYSSKKIHTYLLARGIEAVIPEKDDQKAYKRRNVVERSSNTLKQWRSSATRYDKLALTYRSAVVLQSVVLWSAVLGDTP